MLMAQLRGKLPTDLWMSSEDLLTSAVFGTIKNLPPWVALELFRRVHPMEGSERPTLSEPLRWRFWPWWDTCEPDVVVSDEHNLCVIEAKLFSIFGEDEEVGGQLRREWKDGLRRAPESGQGLWLIAVTNHTSPPFEAMRKQLKGSCASPSRVGWLSWSLIGQYLMELQSEFGGGWRDDLLELLARMGLSPFDGFDESTQLARQVEAAGRPLSELLPPIEDPAIILRAQRIDFRRAMETARELRGCVPMGWALQAGRGAESTGFSDGLSGARAWMQQGGGTWHLT